MFQRTSVGLDVHALSVVACAIDGQTGEVWKQRLCPDSSGDQTVVTLSGPMHCTGRGSAYRLPPTTAASRARTSYSSVVAAASTAPRIAL